MAVLYPMGLVSDWGRAKKTASIKAKPLLSLIVDRSVMSKFLVDTLEGREPVDSSAVFCIGAAGDPWQQTSKALLKKYTVTSIDADGWMVCEPKPENEVQYFEFPRAIEKMDASDFVIQGQWGETIDGIPNLQRVSIGDFVCRQIDDHTDQWVVKRQLFLNTYTIIGAK